MLSISNGSFIGKKKEYNESGIFFLDDTLFPKIISEPDPGVQFEWNGWDGNWSGPDLNTFTNRTDYGDTFGGAYGVAFNNDGTKAYVGGSDGSVYDDEINEFDLSTPYDFTNASFVAGHSQGSGYILALHFSPDGSKLVYFNYSNQRMDSIDLSTPFSLASAGSITTSISVGDNGNTFITPDGYKLFVTGRDSEIDEFDFGAPGDVTTLSFVRSVTVGNDNWYGIYFSGDARTIYLGTRSSDLHYFSLSADYDISTAGNEQIFSIAAPPSTYAVRFTNSGQTLWIGGGSGSSGDISKFTA